MGTTFVEVNEKGFWMRDSILELWLRFASLHIEDTVENESLAHTIRNQWLLASRGYFGGHVPVELNKAVSSEQGKKIVIDAITAFAKELKKAPKTLDKGVLNILGISGEFLSDFETDRLLEICQAFLDLIDGKVGNDASDTSFMPGCK